MPLNMFIKEKRAKDGLTSQCKECNRKHYAEHREEYKAHSKKFRKENAEMVRQRDREYYHKNKESQKGHYKKYYEKNKEILNEKKKEYRKNNPEKIKEYTKKYYSENQKTLQEKSLKYYYDNKEKENKKSLKYYYNHQERLQANHRVWTKLNPDKVKLHHQKRAALKKSLPATLTEKQWNKIKEHFQGQCCYCGKESDELQQEHYVPLSKGGEYTKNNILPACKSCNTSKKDKSFNIWYKSYKHYSKEREQKILKFLGYTKDGSIQQLRIG